MVEIYEYNKLYLQATIICDIVVLYVLKAKHLYKEKKYLEVIGDDAYKVVFLINYDEYCTLHAQHNANMCKYIL